LASFVMPHELVELPSQRLSGDSAEPVPGSDLATEDFFRRLLYPQSEKNLNEHYSDGTCPTSRHPGLVGRQEGQTERVGPNG
jgi:hypothetical protein